MTSPGAIERVPAVELIRATRVRTAKRARRPVRARLAGAAMRWERRLMELSVPTQVRETGLIVFLERRPPRWSGS